MTVTTSPAVELSIEIDATPADIYPFLTEADKLSQWLAEIVDADARPGGSLLGYGRSDDVLACEYIELEPPHRVVLAWGWERGGADGLPPGASRVDISLEALGATTRVHVRHHGLTETLATAHRQGWIPALRYLRAAVAGHPEGYCIGRPGHTCAGARQPEGPPRAKRPRSRSRRQP